MNGDMMGANNPCNFDSTTDTLGFVSMTKTGPLARVRIDGLTEADFTALLSLAQDREDLGNNLILAEVDKEVRLFWNNDIGDSACWRFPEKKRVVVKDAIMEDLRAYNQASAKRGLF
ncbi:MAG: hypothetical protein ACE5IC_10760 [Candidatus Brocadiales bacterium]